MGQVYFLWLRIYKNLESSFGIEKVMIWGVQTGMKRKDWWSDRLRFHILFLSYSKLHFQN